MADSTESGRQAGGPGEDDGERVQRAFEQWSRRASRFLSGAAARAREEAEDILAEAQSLRRGERE